MAADPDRVQDGRWVHDAMIECRHVSAHHQDQASAVLTPIFAAGSYPLAEWMASGCGETASGLCAGILWGGSAAGGYVMG